MTSKFVSYAIALMLSVGGGTALDAKVSAAMAQDASAEHISAARKALAATQATGMFDGILIQAATVLKNRLTSTNPDKADQISTIVDEEAIVLAARRADLENEAARTFSTTFSQAELEQIAQFFASDVGRKYLESAPVLARELGKSARVWANGIQRDLAQNVAKRLNKASN